MAGNCQQVYELLDELAKYSIPAAQKEMKDLTKFAKSQGLKDELQRWDYAYYSEKQKNSLFNLSDETLKPYFKLENVIDGIFSLATNLYGLQFKENPKIDVYHKDVKVYEVYRGKEFIAVKELQDLGIDFNQFWLGVFQADYHPDGSVNWYSLVPTNDKEADFHTPGYLMPCCATPMAEHRGVVLYPNDITSLGLEEWEHRIKIAGINLIGLHAATFLSRFQAVFLISLQGKTMFTPGLIISSTSSVRMPV